MIYNPLREYESIYCDWLVYHFTCPSSQLVSLTLCQSALRCRLLRYLREILRAPFLREAPPVCRDLDRARETVQVLRKQTQVKARPGMTGLQIKVVTHNQLSMAANSFKVILSGSSKERLVQGCYYYYTVRPRLRALFHLPRRQRPNRTGNRLTIYTVWCRLVNSFST